MKKILVFDHSAVVDLYRERERILKNKFGYDIEMVIPFHWMEGSKDTKANKNDYFKIYLASTFLTNNVPLFIYNPFTVIKALLKSKPDIIDIHEEPYSLSCIEIIFLKSIFSRKSKVVFYSAQNILKRYPFPFNLFEKIAYKCSKAAYTCSSEVTSVLIKKGYKKKIMEIPLGIDEKLYRPGIDIEDINKKYDLDSFTIGFIGRIEYQKGIFDLIEALNLMKEYKWKCIIVGNGSSLSDVKKKVEEYWLADRVIFTGAVVPEDIPLYMNAMDVLIVPSRTTSNWKEQFGRVIAEAMACGLPVIGSDSGAIPEVIGSGGVIFKEGDIDGLKNSMIKLMENKEYRERLKKNALEKVKQYSWNSISRQFDELYSYIIKE
ncbi:glycosyltransferase [Thermoanaerobacterium thermosaccharolyticum]|uniref:glycosyltransferase n=1 Tax=Thermoanaerobacterium thermosaccharolyticum TaxID=1517 RepID=UPI001238A483|nr:glycosyltransferase [Thermoanaerobacterium thermosaccharolyticum]KAA5806375.1 glycosyltransferase family 4 protein [Thermoanaerobacterium thermosaccharolyticum]